MLQIELVMSLICLVAILQIHVVLGVEPIVALRNHSRIVFQGDGITGFDREVRRLMLGYAWGQAYPYLIHAQFTAHHYDYNVQISNHGVVAATLDELYVRWSWDGYKLMPDIISVLMGATDIENSIAASIPLNITHMEELFDKMATELRENAPQATLTLMHCFVSEGFFTKGKLEEHFNYTLGLNTALERVATKHRAVLIPLQDIFTELIKSQPYGSYYIFDGRHPTHVGQRVIAEEWMKRFNVAGFSGTNRELWPNSPALDKAEVLFMGDSISDCRRNRSKRQALDHLGHGFIFVLASTMNMLYPANCTGFTNHGFSGHGMEHMAQFWPRAIPHGTMMSVLIGINDVWRSIGDNPRVNVTWYEETYVNLLNMAREVKPNMKFVLCEPFFLPGDITTPNWEIFDVAVPKLQAVVRRLAVRFDAALVPLQTTFNEASKRAPYDHWLLDGIHPYPAGHQLIAEAWAQAVAKKWPI